MCCLDKSGDKIKANYCGPCHFIAIGTPGYATSSIALTNKSFILSVSIPIGI